MESRAYTGRGRGQGKSRDDPESGSASLEESQGLVVAAALEIVPELRVHRGRELLLERGDLFRNGAQPFKMAGRVPGVPVAIRYDGEPLAQSGDERLLDGRRAGHASGLPGLFGLGAFGQELALGLDPVLVFVARQTVMAALFGDEIGTQGDVFAAVRRARVRGAGHGRRNRGFAGPLRFDRRSLRLFDDGLRLGGRFDGPLHGSRCRRRCFGRSGRRSDRFRDAVGFLGHNLRMGCLIDRLG